MDESVYSQHSVVYLIRPFHIHIKWHIIIIQNENNVKHFIIVDVDTNKLTRYTTLPFSSSTPNDTTIQVKCIKGCWLNEQKALKCSVEPWLLLCYVVSASHIENENAKKNLFYNPTT